MSSTNSCIPCRTGKRRCDRAQPTCSTCARVGRICVYDEAFAGVSVAESSAAPLGQSTTLPFHTASPFATVSSGSTPRVATPLANFDAFQWSSTRQATVNTAVAVEVLRQFGSFDAISAVSNTYFSDAHPRLPIVSPVRFRERLVGISPASAADFAALGLAMKVVLQAPVEHVESMQTELYVMIKSVVSLLEATGYHSLETVQCMVLVAYYEFGHGLVANAALTVGSCARLARVIGLHKDGGSGGDRAIEEERRRTWWAVVGLDRYIGMSTLESFPSTPSFTSSSPIPIDDDLWAQNLLPSSPPHTVSTPCSPTIGTFARECQVAYIISSVIRHAFDPSNDEAFQAEESAQLEKTLMAFLPLLLEEEEKLSRFSVALGMCTSALFTLYDCRLKRSLAQRAETAARVNDLSAQYTEFLHRLLPETNSIGALQMSPYMPYCLYQCAVAQRRLADAGEGEYAKERYEWLVEVLGIFGKRWMVARRYLEMFGRDDAEIVVSVQ
ncbi:hypothetical protein EJ04DRAFT_506226 [Polyplosphaeria fusca]|uniref:Zn(2)-C6 fungal-type domain-containing protein n=1 Tax=Polyplosphaeria fusca TaxID=682080 RepID=A0A9P4QLI6_9PLEO|nr:hypothetical protein EJ04DRAFT_506226 [Polyplosphaeria fusca]